MLNFDKTMDEVISEQKVTSRTSCFTEYNSKKKLLESGLLSEEQGTFIQKLKNTFTFYIHADLDFLVITMYYSTTKKYAFLVVDLATLKVAEAESVKVAKQAILEIKQATAETQETAETESK